jgi:hypothetical protein
MDLGVKRVPKNFILPIPVKEDEEAPTPYRNTRREIVDKEVPNGVPNEAEKPANDPQPDTQVLEVTNAEGMMDWGDGKSPENSAE